MYNCDRLIVSRKHINIQRQAENSDFPWNWTACSSSKHIDERIEGADLSLESSYTTSAVPRNYCCRFRMSRIWLGQELHTKTRMCNILMPTNENIHLIGQLHSWHNSLTLEDSKGSWTATLLLANIDLTTIRQELQRNDITSRTVLLNPISLPRVQFRKAIYHPSIITQVQTLGKGKEKPLMYLQPYICRGMSSADQAG